MKKWWLVIFIPIFLGLAFFGLGPILFADGSNIERFLTFLVIVNLYIITTLALRYLLKKKQIVIESFALHINYKKIKR